MKDANLKSPVDFLLTVWFQWYDILVKAKLWKQLKDQWLPGAVGGRDKYAKHRGSLGQWKYSVWYHTDGYMSFIIYLSKPIECTPPRVRPKLNYRLWVIMTCQGRLILSNTCTPVVSDADNGGGCACVGKGHMGNLCTFLSILLHT